MLGEVTTETWYESSSARLDFPVSFICSNISLRIECHKQRVEPFRQSGMGEDPFL
ncbi:hypothetical protein KSD_96570 [Ktedonobacter sp. SOSP1-85]|nr:hypothetical protein KSD_96570 [Ktedonobacter sp. SOSP1-85]